MNETSRNMRQDITYWAPIATDGFGQASFAAPVTFKGRWEENNQVIQNQAGDEVVSKATCYVPIDVLEQGYLLVGISSEADPTTINAADEIKGFAKTPNLRHMSYERRAFL